MPPKRKLRSSDPLKSPAASSSSSIHTVTIKQEADDNSHSFVIGEVFENFNVNGQSEQDYDYDDEDGDLLQEISQEEKPAGKRRKRDKYLNYRREDLINAAELVFGGKMSIFKAARLYAIPKTTLHYYVKNKTANKPIKRPGKECTITENEEDEILEWLKIASDLGAPRMRDDLMQAAADVLRLNKRPGFKNELPSNAWVKRFKARHPGKVKLRNLTVSYDEWRFFTKFHHFLKQNNLLDVLDRPDAFYVMEDTTFELNTRINNSHKRLHLMRALARRGGDPKTFRCKDSVTVTYCFGADGKKLQELVIFNEDFKDIVKVALVDQEIKSKFLFTRTKTGGHTRDSFKCYLLRLDQQLKDVQRPIFIFCSETLPHVSLDLLRWCRGREIFIISFIPNEMRVLEQFDQTIFGINNEGWREEVEKGNSGNKKITEIDFIRLLKVINDRVVSDVKIFEIFQQIGIFPFDMSKINENYCESEEDTDGNNQAETVVAKDIVVMQHLKKMRLMNQHLIEMLRERNFEQLVDNSVNIGQEIDAIEANI